MALQRLQTLSPVAAARLRAPRTSVLLTAGALVRRFGLAVWRVLEDEGHRRAARELRDVAARVETNDPALARSLRAASWYNRPT
jgi:hypothetical protein